jgi:hypothetical protein
MKRNQQRRRALEIVLVALALAANEPSLLAQSTQAPGKLRAADVLPPSVLRAEYYSVDETVWNDGLINTYQVTTKDGVLSIESTALLEKRLHELRAIESIERLKKSDVYLNALEKTATAPVKTAKGLVTDPVKTTEGVVTGVGRWFRGIGSAVTSDDPHKDKLVESATGHAQAKRQFAREFGVDPYSPFPPLQKALNDTAWAAAGGSLTVSGALSAIPGAVGVAAVTTKAASDMKDLVRDSTPAELTQMNAEKLGRMGVPEAIVRRFLNCPAFGPEEQTILVGELDSMSGVQDRRLFVEKAATAVDEPTAIFNRTQAQMMAAYHARVGRLARCIEAGGAVLVEREGSGVVGLFPLDHVVWMEGVRQKEQALSAALKARADTKPKELWITGTLDPSAEEGLTAAGWKVTPRAGDRLFAR